VNTQKIHPDYLFFSHSLIVITEEDYISVELLLFLSSFLYRYQTMIEKEEENSSFVLMLLFGEIFFWDMMTHQQLRVK